MSRGFRFRLEMVLQQRARQEQTVQLALAQALRAQAQAQAEAERLRSQLEAEQHQLVVPGSPFDLERRMHLLLHIDRATRQLGQQEQVVGQHLQQVEKVRDLLRQASARKRALERLRERQREEFNHEEQRRMNQELDEQGALRFARLPRERKEADAPVVDH